MKQTTGVALLSLALIVAGLAASNVEARHYRRVQVYAAPDWGIFSLFAHQPVRSVKYKHIHRHMTSRQVHRHRDAAHARRAKVHLAARPTVHHHLITSAHARVVGGRPAGCPYQFCGCGASLYKFGRIIPSLNLAANWLRFPRALAAAGMAAVSRHHVMILEAPTARPGVWRVYDPNGGLHLIWRHERSIRGYTIVNPQASAP